jgi:lysylphosphatidylglycerol synthetase-like protein (DUF2156 family)
MTTQEALTAKLFEAFYTHGRVLFLMSLAPFADFADDTWWSRVFLLGLKCAP